MVKRILRYFMARPGLAVLVGILVVIAATNLKPDLYLLGWDNYSSYFNLGGNIFRTFFATWRQYRGVGVPSDSESTDLFRQLFYLLLSPVVKTQLLDQVYIIFALSCGVISLYFLARALFGKLLRHPYAVDIAGFVAAVFYLFNLNTLATFYFPMIMFVDRFFSVPLVFLAALTMLRKGKSVRKRDYLLFAALVLLTSGMNMTATVFITVLFVLLLFIAGEHGRKAATAGLFVLFILLNSFWLLSFANYTVEKSKTVNDAPTFIEANEIQLNKPSSYYTFEKQFTLYPSFFDTTINSLDMTKATGYHPITGLLGTPFVRTYLLLISGLSFAGVLYILLTWLKRRQFLWIPAVYITFLLLSMKEFSPLGFVYAYFEKNIPFFANLFRFGDTKFHYFIAFSGSLAAGYLLGRFASRLSRAAFTLCLVLLCGGLFIYYGYFNGHLFGFFMRNQVPEAYFRMAKIMDADPRDGRVLHVPYDENGYWRSYSWGYLGSSFLHFMMDRPLLEKTFEPASAENARINDEIYQRVVNMQSVIGQGRGGVDIESMYDFLRRVGVRYVIMDGTVSSEMPTKGISLWGTFNMRDFQAMVDGLSRSGYMKEVARYPVKVSDYMQSYDKIFPLSAEQLRRVASMPAQEIVLYEVADPQPEIQMVGMNSLDSAYQPFQDENASYTVDGNLVRLAARDMALKKDVPYTVSTDTPSGQRQLELYARTDNTNLILNFMAVDIPDLTVNQSKLDSRKVIKTIDIPLKTLTPDALQPIGAGYLSNWNRFPTAAFTSVRIRVGDTYLPLPPLKATDSFVGALTVDGSTLPVSVLIPEKRYSISSNQFRLTDRPNCFGDAIKEYSSYRKDGPGEVTIGGQNGSTCFIADLASQIDSSDTYLEFHMDYTASEKDLDAEAVASSKPRLEGQVKSLPKPNNLYVCLKDEAVSACYNTHQILNLAPQGSITIPTEKQFGAYHPIAMFALKNTGLQSQQITIGRREVVSYKQVSEADVLIPQSGIESFTFKPAADGQLNLTFSLPMDAGSFYEGKNDGFLISNGACGRPGSYRTFRMTDKGLLSFFNNCDNTLFQTLDFDSSHMYVWMVDYNLASGKFPRFQLGDGFFNYKNNYLSLGQGYPDIAGFKLYQYPETVFSNRAEIANKLKTLRMVPTYTVVAPHPEYADNGSKGFTISQDSENEGLAVYNNFTVLTLPGSWYGLTIREKSATPVSPPPVIRYRNILPSLWEVSSAEGGVLLLNEAYDRQWGVYGGMTDLLLGRQLPAGHYRCQEYFNCFVLAKGVSPRYIFYWPEKLNLLGWFITVLSVLGGVMIIRRRKHIRHNAASD